MNRLERLPFLEELKNAISSWPTLDIENGIMCYCLEKLGKPYNNYLLGAASEVQRILHLKNMPTDFETIIEFFEILMEDNNKSENGIVFTPKYISDYIVETVLAVEPWESSKTFIDPGCGGGIFLISAAEALMKRYQLDVDYVIENCIFGIDIDPDNVRRCELSLRLLSAAHGGSFDEIKCNVICRDSLKIIWHEEFGKEAFNYIIGNPPYVNPHDMNQDTVQFLKKSFQTTKSGVFNVFYAFIEHAMSLVSENGVLGYIVPNNFLTIKSALDLRLFIQKNRYLRSILDFGDNMAFRPVRTYNCILCLAKTAMEVFRYHVLPRVDDLEKSIHTVSFHDMQSERLDENGWKLVDEHTRRTLYKIESNPISIKPIIRTGIATLKDAAFMVEKDAAGYYKIVDGSKLYIEDGLVKPIYKIPELKLYDSIDKAERYIIFPYVKAANGYVLIAEDSFMSNYPSTYKALLSVKDALDSRDKGRPNLQGWYAYGRTQGLNKYGQKLLFPTFANKPKFQLIENEDALFCNGYGIFRHENYDLVLLSKILNSKIMAYYVSHTSYSIEGGYYCYQKKYIERFSIPELTEGQIAEIKLLDGDELDNYLWSLYGLDQEVSYGC